MSTTPEWHAVSPDYLVGEPTIQLPTYGFQVARPILPEPGVPILVAMAAFLAFCIRRVVPLVVLGLFFGLLLPSCTTTDGRVAVSTITSEPVAPSVSHASQTVQDAGKSGAVLKQQNKELSNQVHQSNQALDAAIKRAEYLSHAGSATKAQLDDALNFLKSEQTAKLEMQRQIDAMTATIEALNNQITDAGQALSEALEKAGKADQAQKTLVATATAQSDLAKANAKEAADWKTKYEAAAPYQRAAHIVYWVLGIYLVLLILKFVAPPPYSALFALVPVPKF